MDKKNRTVRSGSESEAPDKSAQSEVDVYSVQLPFFRVYPITWMDYSEPDKLLAISRGNSTVEIWSYPYWHLVTKVHLQREVSIRKAFITRKDGQASYLVIVTANAYVITYDLINGEFKQNLLHGGDFAFDADFLHHVEKEYIPRKASDAMDEEKLERLSRKSSRAFDDDGELIGRLILACNDGSCREFELSNSGLLSLRFSTQAKDEKATACCFSRGRMEIANSFCVGYDSGDIRIFSYKTKQLVTLISGDKAKDNKSTIWALTTMEPHYVVAGSSSGCIKIHETKYGTLLKEFREHKADILALTTSADQTKLFGSGADSQVVIVGKHTREIDGLEIDEFKINSKDRGQSHDVYCLIELHEDLLISAGNSTDICLYKLDHERFLDRGLGSKSKSKLRHITSVNASKHLEYNFKSELMLINTNQNVDVFHFERERGSLDYLAKISIDEFTIKAVTLSQTAAYFCIASAGKTEIFSFNKKQKTLARITTDFTELVAKHVCFAGQKLFFITETNPELIQSFDMATSKTTKYECAEVASVKSIDIFTVHGDGDRVLIGDKLNRKLIVYNTSSRKTLDLSGYRKARVMDAILCKSTASVFIIYETNTLLKVDSAGKVVYFSSGHLPHEIHKLHDRYYGLQSHPKSKHKLLMCSLYSFIRVDTRLKYEELERLPETQVLQLPGAREEPTKESQLSIVKTSKPMLGMQLGPSGSLLVVRFDWKSAMNEIPHPVITKKFGL